jgi:hypothetical protein
MALSGTGSLGSGTSAFVAVTFELTAPTVVEGAAGVATGGLVVAGAVVVAPFPFFVVFVVFFVVFFAAASAVVDAARRLLRVSAKSTEACVRFISVLQS